MKIPLKGQSISTALPKDQRNVRKKNNKQIEERKNYKLNLFSQMKTAMISNESKRDVKVELKTEIEATKILPDAAACVAYFLGQ